MGGSHLALLSRRQFVTRVMPMCALTCVAGGSALAWGQTEEPVEDEAKHKFDQDTGWNMTFRQMYSYRYGEPIRLLRAFAEEIGQDRLIGFLREDSNRKMLEFGQQQAERSPAKGFAAYTAQFKDPARYKNTLTLEIVEDTERAFELNVTECLWATTFLEADAADIGYPFICYGDYAWARGFNPKIEMVRDKTLMQGHSCCNHRYLWTG